MTFIAGPYTATYNPGLGSAGGSDHQSLGIVEDGFTLESVYFSEPIRGDNLGESIQDGVYRGKDVFLSAVFEEWDLGGLRRALNPFIDCDALSDRSELGQVGRLHTNMAGILILTAVAGTTAATVPATLTANKAILAPNFPIQELFATKLRKVPLRFQLLPYTDGGDIVHFRYA